MPITWRRAVWADIEEGISIQPKNWGDALVGLQAALEAWRYITASPFFASAVLERKTGHKGTELIGFGAAIFVKSDFADAEIRKTSPDINSRFVAGIAGGRPLLATYEEVAQANAGEGVDVLVLCGNWHDEKINSDERHKMQTLYASSFAECLGGYRIRRILYETADAPAEQFVRDSVVYKAIAAFPELGRATFVMSRESVREVPASIGNVIFSYTEPVFGLRESDQQLLGAAVNGATDSELASELGVTAAAIKARWRSIFARIDSVIPDLVSDDREDEYRGLQKRHRVLAYIRLHPEELRPYDPKRRRSSPGDLESSASA
jgi:hypothetical protein